MPAVETRVFDESVKAIERTAAHYRVFAANRIDTPKELNFHKRMVADRRWYQAKQIIKRALGRDLRAPASGTRASPSGTMSQSAGSQR